MEEGTVTEWLVKVGQAVAVGDVLAVISTDKIDTDFESPAAGVVAALLVPQGDTVPCGAGLIVIAEDQADFDAWDK